MAFIEWVEVYYQRFYNQFLSGPLKKRIKSLLIDFNIKDIFDTQPLFTPVIEAACANTPSNQIVHYHKVFTDLPTHYAKHFLSGIKQLQHFPNVIFRTHALKPLLDKYETADLFWQNEAKLLSTHIESKFAMPVNVHYFEQPDNSQITVEIAPKWIERFHLNVDGHTLSIEPDAKILTLMLGSQGVDAVYAYCQAYIEQLQNQNISQPHYCLIACSRNEKLYERITCLLDETNLKAHKIIPLKMQPLQNIASMMWRSDTVVIRSSGLSCIEQIALREKRKNPPKLFIHSPSSRHDSTDVLLNATHGWERGNAAYMMQLHQAEITTPYGVRFFG